MPLAHKKPYSEFDKAPTPLSVRLVSWFENEVDIHVFWLRNYRRSISVLCGAIAYLIGCGSIILLAIYSTGERVGYGGFYYIDNVLVETTNAMGHTELTYRKAILPSFKLIEMLVAGTAVGIIGFKVGYLLRNRWVLVPVTGLIAMLLAWLALVVFFLSI